MKRTGFKKPTIEQVKAKNALKRQKKINTMKVSSLHKKTPQKSKTKQLKALKNTLWELCKQITRLRYKNLNGTWNC